MFLEPACSLDKGGSRQTSMRSHSLFLLYSSLFACQDLEQPWNRVQSVVNYLPIHPIELILKENPGCIKLSLG